MDRKIKWRIGEKKKNIKSGKEKGWNVSLLMSKRECVMVKKFWPENEMFFTLIYAKHFLTLRSNCTLGILLNVALQVYHRFSTTILRILKII